MKKGEEEGEGREGVDMRNDMEVRTEGREMTLFDSVAPRMVFYGERLLRARLSCGVLSSSHVVCSVAGREMLANCVAADVDLSEFPRPEDILNSSSLGDIRHREDFQFLIQATIEHLSRQCATSMLCS